MISRTKFARKFSLNEQAFTEIVQQAIAYNQLERYFISPKGGASDVASHYDLEPNITEIKTDQTSAGGLKLSHAQRRMLMVLVALWDGRIADETFGESLGSLPKIVQSMDKNNRELLGDLMMTYPGWR